MADLEQAMEEAKRIAQTPEGKQLAMLLQQLGGGDLQQSLDAAAAGDLQQARQVIHTLMKDPQARQILNKLGGGYGK